MTHERLIVLDADYSTHSTLRYERDATSDPTTAQDATLELGKAFDYGSLYLNRTTGDLWYCADPTISSAVWRKVAVIGSISHDTDLTGVSADDHHAQSHAHDGADSSGTVAHSDTTGQGTDDHHSQQHAIDGGDHTGTLDHSEIANVGTDDHHSEAHDISGAAHTGSLEDSDIPASIARDTEVTSAISAHEGDADPHPDYLTAAEGDAAYEAAGAVSTHAGLTDPHTGYRREDEDHSHASTGAQGGTVAHSALSGVSADQHHARSHDHSAAGDGTALAPVSIGGFQLTGDVAADSAGVHSLGALATWLGDIFGQDYWGIEQSDSSAPGMNFIRRRAAGATVADNDDLGYVDFEGHDGTSDIQGASITGRVDGAVSTGVMPVELVFSTNPGAGSIERWTMRPSGILEPVTDSALDIGSSSKRVQHLYAEGIAFPATQVASADPNTLDDYEEGTWTPVVTFGTPGDLSVAYSTQAATYTRIGRLVRLNLNIVTTTFTYTTASGNFRITGLPFEPGADRQPGNASLRGYTIGTTQQFAISARPTSAKVEFNLSREASSIASMQAGGSVPTGGTIEIRGEVWYVI